MNENVKKELDKIFNGEDCKRLKGVLFTLGDIPSQKLSVAVSEPSASAPSEKSSKKNIGGIAGAVILGIIGLLAFKVVGLIAGAVGGYFLGAWLLKKISS